LGYCFGRLGKNEEVIVAYKKAIELDPDYTIAHYNLARTYRKLGNYLDAVDAYKQVIRIKPDLASAHYDIGTTYLQLKNSDAAFNEYKILKDLDIKLANKLFSEIELQSKQ